MIVALRVLLLALAAAALAAAVAIGLGGRQADRAATAVRYACPMHPEVRAGAPGECPICRMALERVGHPATPATRANAAENADFAAVENIRRHNIIDFVRYRSLLVPSRELRGPAFVSADGEVTALFYDDQNRRARRGRARDLHADRRACCRDPAPSGGRPRRALGSLERAHSLSTSRGSRGTTARAG